MKLLEHTLGLLQVKGPKGINFLNDSEGVRKSRCFYQMFSLQLIEIQAQWFG